MRTEKISDLSVSHFVAVPSRGGTAHSIVSITLDGLRLPEVPIVGGVKPNSGQNIIAAFRNKSKTSLVGWIDPVTHAPIVVIPKIVTYYPIILALLFPLLTVLLITAEPSHREIRFWVAMAFVAALILIQGIGWPGVRRQLMKAKSQGESVQKNINEQPPSSLKP